MPCSDKVAQLFRPRPWKYVVPTYTQLLSQVAVHSTRLRPAPCNSAVRLHHHVRERAGDGVAPGGEGAMIDVLLRTIIVTNARSQSHPHVCAH